MGAEVRVLDVEVQRRAVVELLGVLSYAELTAFDRLAEDARMAPTLAGRAALARMAAAEIAHHDRLSARLVELGVDPADAMAPFVAALDGFHDQTRAGSWLEGLVKAHVGDGLATDFYREVATFLPQPDRGLVEEVLADTGHADFAVREVRAAIAADPTQAGRLALWARRLVGEALTQSQAVIAEHDDLADLMMTGTGDLAGVGKLLQRLTAAHGVRMKALGLNP
ncbi:tRNA-(MS[2]IO[6]A)-hydroxylase MiaE-like protein [Modestobacter roseus]|uniref:tRNA-(MS[2]IO[6]A)-hydroxylase MiaE-like protein n=1 Tax=Modestobacter roseus TaxID=1181884 RepID=A0A562ITH0_9ACTN|nr:ferritin-like fold-containing protein [Modestobacter roseus]TWH74130.1 tRNA-(MS[2]IO[6]A)-hydroxylase MiaE-like protein [Modestobacter roseus]